MVLLSESYKNRLKQLAGILDEASWGTGNTSDAEREEAFAKTNERVPYKKDLMIYAIKGGFEIGLLFKTKNEKDQMPIAKYRTVLPLAIGMGRKGNEVLSAFHEIGQSESKARETGRRSAEAKNEWRLFKTKNILSMWLTGKTFNTAPQGFKGGSDSRMSTVEVYFKPDVAKKIQAQQNTEKEQQAGEREKLVSRGMPEPENKQIATPTVKKQEPRQLPIKSVAPIEKAKPAVKMSPATNKKPTMKPAVKPIEKEKSAINKSKPTVKPLGYKPKEKELNTYVD